MWWSEVWCGVVCSGMEWTCSWSATSLVTSSTIGFPTVACAWPFVGVTVPPAIKTSTTVPSVAGGAGSVRGGSVEIVVAAVDAAWPVDDVESVVVDPQPTSANSVAAAAMTATNRDALAITGSRSSRRRGPAWDRGRLLVRDVGSDGQ